MIFQLTQYNSGVTLKPRYWFSREQKRCSVAVGCMTNSATTH